jgi:tight adherence protein C
MGMSDLNTTIAVMLGLVLGMLGPNYALRMLGARVQRLLRLGLPDALDLMVVCAEAGIALESALERVARDMEGTNRPVALELALLIHELRVIGDRREAFQRMANRTEIDGFKRLATTLAQAVRYGTPLSQALRTLAVEMRSDRMIAIEEKAVRLPALLVMPLILFILPALFIALAGPSLVGMSDLLSNLGRS